MAPRPGVARPRDIDFSAVGKAGRRTGITLPQQKLDEHGLEEVSNLFSSPRKPSPLKNVINAEVLGFTPGQPLATRKTPRASIPRSASPRKTGISGAARRSNGVDLRTINREPEILASDPADVEEVPPSSPTRANYSARRYIEGTESTALRDITSKNTPNVRDWSNRDKSIINEAKRVASIEDEYQPLRATSPEQVDNENYAAVDEQGPTLGDDDDYPEDIQEEDFRASEEPPPHFDDEEADQTFEPEPAFPPRAKANSRRKRKSDLEVPTSPPPPKRSRKSSYEPSRHQTLSSEPERMRSPALVAEYSQAPTKGKLTKARQPLKAKTNNSKLAARIPKAIDDVVQKIRARPNAPKSLYILRRETPADDSVARTRSGRPSFRPLAWWKNEQCIYGGSPGAGITDGARFPLNSIKEIIRTEDSVEPMPKSKKKKRRGKGQARSRSKAPAVEESESEEEGDLDAEPWETEVGTLRGHVSVWDAQAQAPLDEQEEIDIAYAPAAIETSTVKINNSSGPTFKYAKLLGNKFMGVGLVDLEPGGIKRPKNSRKMHMSFFVVKGRVTVHVGPAGGDRVDKWTSFSIGKGGFWQVPRGNQYSIENILDRPARIFFSQGCEVTLEDEEE